MNLLKQFTISNDIEGERKSSLISAFENARLIAGRDRATGARGYNMLVSFNEDSFLDPISPIASISYLLILDMIGNIYKLKNGSDEKGIIGALKMFSDSNDEQIGVIKALRNCLTHDFGLFNIPENRNNDNFQLHRFSLDNIDEDWLYQLSKKEDRLVRPVDFSKRTNKNYTRINYKKLHDLVEGVYAILIAKIERNEVDFKIDKNELFAKFTTMY